MYFVRAFLYKFFWHRWVLSFTAGHAVRIRRMLSGFVSYITLPFSPCTCFWLPLISTKRPVMKMWPKPNCKLNAGDPKRRIHNNLKIPNKPVKPNRESKKPTPGFWRWYCNNFMSWETFIYFTKSGWEESFEKILSLLCFKDIHLFQCFFFKWMAFWWVTAHFFSELRFAVVFCFTIPYIPPVALTFLYWTCLLPILIQGTHILSWYGEKRAVVFPAQLCRLVYLHLQVCDCTSCVPHASIYICRLA